MNRAQRTGAQHSRLTTNPTIAVSAASQCADPAPHTPAVRSEPLYSFLQTIKTSTAVSEDLVKYLWLCEHKICLLFVFLSITLRPSVDIQHHPAVPVPALHPTYRERYIYTYIPGIPHIYIYIYISVWSQAMLWYGPRENPSPAKCTWLSGCLLWVRLLSDCRCGCEKRDICTYR